MAVDKNAAAISITAIIQLVCTAETSVSKNTSLVICRVSIIIIKVATTPTAAASDGVAIPL
jgi:hypothetical protein